MFTTVLHNFVLSCKPTDYFDSSTVVTVPMKLNHHLSPVCPEEKMCAKPIYRIESPKAPRGLFVHLIPVFNATISIPMYKMLLACVVSQLCHHICNMCHVYFSCELYF